MLPHHHPTMQSQTPTAAMSCSHPTAQPGHVGIPSQGPPPKTLSLGLDVNTGDLCHCNHNGI